MFIYLLVHNLSELFTLLLPLAPLPEKGLPSGPRPQRLTQHGGAALNPPACPIAASPESGVSAGLRQLRVCSGLTLPTGTYRPISCYTIALDD